MSCSTPVWSLAGDWLVVPCDWVDEPAAQGVVPVRLGGVQCVMQQRLASQLVVHWGTVLHGVCFQSRLDLFLSAQPGHADSHSVGRAVCALGRRCLHPSSLRHTAESLITPAYVPHFLKGLHHAGNRTKLKVNQDLQTNCKLWSYRVATMLHSLLCIAAVARQWKGY